MITKIFTRVIFALCFAMIIGCGNVLAQNESVNAMPELFLIGKVETDVKEDALVDKHALINSASDDLQLMLKDVHFTDNLMTFTVSLETSLSASGNSGSSNRLYLNGDVLKSGSGMGFEPGPQVFTETYAWYDSPSVYGMDWKTLRITYEDLFFTFSDGGGRIYIAPASDYSWSFVFHNPETDDYNADGLAQTVDEAGIHTYGDSFDVYLGGGLISKGPSGDYDVLSLNLITKSNLLNSYGSQESMWYNGLHQMGGGSSAAFDGDGNPELPADGKFTQSDHFVWNVPTDFSVGANDLGIWAKSVSFEITCCGPSVDPDMGYTWTWTDELTDLTGSPIYPVEIVQFNRVYERLPQPDDLALLSQTSKDITMDIVSMDFETIPLSRLYGNPAETGEKTYFRIDLCYTLPDDGEWMVWPDSIQVGDTEIFASSYFDGGMICAAADAPGRKCGGVRYDNTGMDLDWEQPVSLEIRNMAAIPREGSPCSDIMHRYATNSAAQALGVTVSCEDNVTDEWVRGPKDYILTVVAPEDSQESAEKMLAKLKNVLTYHIEGNWQLIIENVGNYIKN